MKKDKIGEIIAMASRKPADESAWVGRLATTKEGEPIPTVANALIIFKHDPVLKGLLGYNAFTGQLLIMREPPLADVGSVNIPGPYPRPWETAHVTMILAYLQRIWSSRISEKTAESAMVADATLNQFHPIVDWLRDLKWDQTPRINNWLVNAFDCEASDFNKAVGTKFLIAAVRRVMRPGVKFDQMMVLEGEQGIGKSKSLRALFGAEWFSDSIPSDLTSKDAAMALLGVWGLEFAEIEHLIRAEVETIKAFLSRSVDRYRPPYGRNYVERPRQGVLIGTTNSEDYLRDVTGNRRIWPVKCKSADDKWVEVNREQLWAEAVVREANGEPIWLDTDDLHQAAASAQADRLSTDAWLEPIGDWLSGKTETTLHDVMFRAINIPTERMTKAAEMRVGKVMRQLDWKRILRRVAGVPARVWLPKAAAEEEERRNHLGAERNHLNGVGETTSEEGW